MSMLHPPIFGDSYFSCYWSMAFHPTVFPETVRTGIAVTISQGSSEAKNLGDDNREEK